MAEGESKTSHETSESVCKHLILEYAYALFYRAKTLSDDRESKKDIVLEAWRDMENASKELIRLYLTFGL